MDFWIEILHLQNYHIMLNLNIVNVLLVIAKCVLNRPNLAKIYKKQLGAASCKTPLILYILSKFYVVEYSFAND